MVKCSALKATEAQFCWKKKGKNGRKVQKDENNNNKDNGSNLFCQDYEMLIQNY